MDMTMDKDMNMDAGMDSASDFHCNRLELTFWSVISFLSVSISVDFYFEQIDSI